MNAIGPLPLPTDNLYKFCALTGVAIVLFVFYTVGRLSDDLLQRVNAETLAVDKAEIELDFLTRLTDQIDEIVNNAKANLSDEEARKQGKVPLHISEEELQKLVERADELRRDSGLKLAELHSANREIGQAQSRLKFVRLVGAVLASIGAWFALHGFQKWSVIQKMQDLALERQTAELRQKPAKVKTSAGQGGSE